MPPTLQNKCAANHGALLLFVRNCSKCMHVCMHVHTYIGICLAYNCMCLLGRCCATLDPIAKRRKRVGILVDESIMCVQGIAGKSRMKQDSLATTCAQSRWRFHYVAATRLTAKLQ